VNAKNFFAELKRRNVFKVAIAYGVVCTGVAFAASPLARAQQATSATLSEYSHPVKATPTLSPEKRTSEPFEEIISTKTPSQKPAPVAEQTPRAEELASPAATAENKTRVKRHATPAAHPMSLSAVKAVAISAPLPGYPYQAKRANITGRGICGLIVNKASGKVTSAVMVQSTGNAILDKVTTDTFRRWRFQPRRVSRVRVPISYGY
jgi:TonB family protein